MNNETQLSAFYSIFADNLRIMNFTTILQDNLQGRFIFTKEELVKALSGYNDNPKTITWRIHDLKEKGIIQNIGRGIYTWNTKTQYVPDISERSKILYKNIHDRLPYANICITETKWFNEFMRHQVFNSYLIVETEKEVTGVLFNNLKEIGEDAFLNPDAQIYSTYISTVENPVIVKPLITESPLQLVEQIYVPTLEKMLVDLISDKETYSAQETEADGIFRTATEKYNMNSSRLMRYARRRNKKNDLHTYYQPLI